MSVFTGTFYIQNSNCYLDNLSSDFFRCCFFVFLVVDLSQPVSENCLQPCMQYIYSARGFYMGDTSNFVQKDFSTGTFWLTFSSLGVGFDSVRLFTLKLFSHVFPVFSLDRRNSDNRMLQINPTMALFQYFLLFLYFSFS